jgi:hypothetical protein
MRVFISKYEVRMIIIKENQFHDMGKTLLYTCVLLTKFTLKYNLLL